MERKREEVEERRTRGCPEEQAKAEQQRSEVQGGETTRGVAILSNPIVRRKALGYSLEVPLDSYQYSVLQVLAL